MCYIEGTAEKLLVHDGELKGVLVAGTNGAQHELHAEQLLAFFGLHPKLGPIAEWGLALDEARDPRGYREISDEHAGHLCRR